jgi:hypothetical protein
MVFLGGAIKKTSVLVDSFICSLQYVQFTGIEMLGTILINCRIQNGDINGMLTVMLVFITIFSSSAPAAVVNGLESNPQPWVEEVSVLPLCYHL